MPDPTKGYLLSKILIGASKLRGKEDVRLPILPHILKKLIIALDSTSLNTYMRSMYKATYLLMFYAFLRISEITVPNKYETSKVLTLQDIKLFGSSSGVSSMSVKFSQFKHHSGEPITLKIRARNTALCPVAAMVKYLRLRGSTAGPLFMTDKFAPLATYTFTKMFKTTLNLCNLDQNLYKTHSFRIGAATACAQKGITFDVIRRLGRWQSDAFKHYIRHATYTY